MANRQTPASGKASTSAAGAPAASASNPAPTRVVIAEDEALIRLDLREMLEEEGYEIVGEAGDGEQAIELAQSLLPDLVICDVKMPKLDGIAAASRIAEERIAPVVILTAFSQRDLIERARDAGAMAYLVKPFQKKDLLPAIEMATSRYSEIKALEAEVTDLQGRLDARKVIERAKGMLQADQGMTEPEAFRWIQRSAMDQRTSMKAVAELVVAAQLARDEAAAAASGDGGASAGGSGGSAEPPAKPRSPRA